MTKKKRNWIAWIVVAASAATILAFQNCSRLPINSNISKPASATSEASTGIR